MEKWVKIFFFLNFSYFLRRKPKVILLRITWCFDSMVELIATELMCRKIRRIEWHFIFLSHRMNTWIRTLWRIEFNLRRIWTSFASFLYLFRAVLQSIKTEMICSARVCMIDRFILHERTNLPMQHRPCPVNISSTHFHISLFRSSSWPAQSDFSRRHSCFFLVAIIFGWCSIIIWFWCNKCTAAQRLAYIIRIMSEENW